MPNDTYLNLPNSRATKMVYDPKKKTWVPQTTNDVSTNEGVSISTGSTTSTTPATPSVVVSTGTNSPTSSKVTTQTNTKAASDKQLIENEYNTLEGELEVVPCLEAMKLKVNDTIQILGIGNFLSGRYFVSKIERILDSDSGLTIRITVIKTGFGDSLKAPVIQENTDTNGRPEEVEKSTSTFKVGDKVKIVGDNAVYSNAHDGVKIPEWVKKQTHTICEISKDNTRVLLKEIFSWTYTKYIQKV